MAGVVALAAAGAALTPFFAVQVLVGVGALLAVPFLVARSDLAWPSLSREDLRRLAIVALPVALASIVTAFYVRILIVLASLLTSEYETGLFVTSARIMEMLGGVALLVVGVILPVATVAARDDRGRLRYVLAHTTKMALLGGGLLALDVVVAARPIVVLLGGEEFAPAASVLRLQAPVALTIFLVYAWTTFLIADGHRRCAGAVHAHRPCGAVRDGRAAHRAVRRRGRRARRGGGRPGAHGGDPSAPCGTLATAASESRRGYLARYVASAGSRRRQSRSRSSPWRRRPSPPSPRPPPSPALAFALRLVPSELTALAPGPLISRAAAHESDAPPRAPRSTGRDSRRAHGSPSARGGPGSCTIRRSGSTAFGQTRSAPAASRRSR